MEAPEKGSHTKEKKGKHKEKKEKEKERKEKGSAMKEKKGAERTLGSASGSTTQAGPKEKKRVVYTLSVQTLLDRLHTHSIDDASTAADAVNALRNLSPEDRAGLAKALQNPDICLSLSGVILSPTFGVSGAPLCGVLWELFSAEEDVRLAACGLVPALLLARSVRHAYFAPASTIDAALQGAYAALQRERKGAALIFMTPQTTEPSVYHTPVHVSKPTLTADALARHDRVRGKAVQVDEPMDTLVDGTADASLRVARAALRLFSDRLSLLPAHVLELFCLISHRLVAAGYAFDPDVSPVSAIAALDLRYALTPIVAKQEPAGPTVARKRVVLGGPFLSLMLHSLVFCLDAPSATPLAKAAIAALQQRATIELIPQVLVATTALLSVVPPSQHASA